MLRCRDLMRREVWSCRAGEPIGRAARLMAEHAVGFLPVVDGRRRLVGVVTDRDLVVRGLAAGLGAEAPVERVMSRGVLTCRAADPLARAEALMASEKKSRVPVVDESGECIGVISLSDLAHAAAPEQAGELLGRITEREVPPGIH